MVRITAVRVIAANAVYCVPLKEAYFVTGYKICVGMGETAFFSTLVVRVKSNVSATVLCFVIRLIYLYFVRSTLKSFFVISVFKRAKGNLKLIRTARYKNNAFSKCFIKLKCKIFRIGFMYDYFIAFVIFAFINRVNFFAVSRKKLFLSVYNF